MKPLLKYFLAVSLQELSTMVLPLLTTLLMSSAMTLIPLRMKALTNEKFAN